MRTKIIVLSTLLVFVLVPGVFPARAFTTFVKYNGSSEATIYYSIDPNIGSLMRVDQTAAANAIRSAAQTWDQATIVAFVEKPYPDGNPITARDFTTNPPPCGENLDAIARVCHYGSGTTLSFTPFYFNTYYLFNTNNNGWIGYDVQSVATHEFGHFFALQHTAYGYPYSVMGPTTIERTIGEDDKRGVTQMYGPYTGFDYGRAEGIQYTTSYDHTRYNTYEARVTNWFNTANTVPELGPVSTETINGITVAPAYGAKMLRFAGTATSTASYVYFKLFSTLDDEGTMKQGTFIPPGTLLKWCQYNFQQRTFSIDAYFTDGTTLRDSGLILDASGQSIHSARRTDPTGVWKCYGVDLTPVAYKTVLHWYVAYDNRNASPATGQFRAYFDSIKLVYSRGKP